MVNTYSQSLQARVGELPFALSEITDNYHVIGFDTTDEDDAHLMPNEMVYFKCSVYWVMTYSVFDIAAHVANSVYLIHMDERDVSFKQLLLGRWKTLPMYAAATKIARRVSFNSDFPYDTGQK